MDTLEKLVSGLPPFMQDEVCDFVAFFNIEACTPGNKLKQTWAGRLSAFKIQNTSVDQH